MKLETVGFFRELDHGSKRGPSLQKAVTAGRPWEDQAAAVAYLRAAPTYFATFGPTKDVIDPEHPIIDPPHFKTDGRFVWPLDLAHYVERYHVALPEAFVAHMRALDWQPPETVDLASLKVELE